LETVSAGFLHLKCSSWCQTDRNEDRTHKLYISSDCEKPLCCCCCFYYKHDDNYCLLLL